MAYHYIVGSTFAYAHRFFQVVAADDTHVTARAISIARSPEGDAIGRVDDFVPFDGFTEAENERGRRCKVREDGLIEMDPSDGTKLGHPWVGTLRWRDA